MIIHERKISDERLIISIVEIAKEAGEAITEIYNSDFDYQLKKDLSPITSADKLSHNIITKRLKTLTPEIPILSEENCDIPYKIRSQWTQYWLVDPLDGTKEFISRNGEFTVNIALIDNNKPILGVIHIPVTNETYWGSQLNGSFYSNESNNVKKIHVSENNLSPIRLVVSRSHPSEALDSLLEKIVDCEIIKVGSSIKFCLIASGKADFYPRFGLTSEWDTAAGTAIVQFAGGLVITTNCNAMHYNLKEDYLNPNFIACNDKIVLERVFSSIK